MMSRFPPDQRIIRINLREPLTGIAFSPLLYGPYGMSHKFEKIAEFSILKNDNKLNPPVLDRLICVVFAFDKIEH